MLPQSDTEAYLWAKKAAEAGLAKAQYAVGYFSEVSWLTFFVESLAFHRSVGRSGMWSFGAGEACEVMERNGITDGPRVYSYTCVGRRRHSAILT